MSIETKANPEVMELDAQTFKDLEVFESPKEGANLFQLCNRTRNKQGAKALRARMERPWSSPIRIHAVQKSIAFLLANKKVFDHLPTFVTTEIVEKYFHGSLPQIMSNNSFEFFLGVFELRVGDVVRFFMIKRGVETTATLIRSLREIVRAPELNSSDIENGELGELGELINEMRTLLNHPKFSQIPEKESAILNTWKVLRIDQVFRIHEKQHLGRLLQLIYEIDALLAMANTTKKYDFIMPTIQEGDLAIQAEAVVHPFIPNMVANPVSLNQESRLLFLTGPNMAGKTTYLRACAIALYFAHLGMGVPARSFSFVPAQRIFSSINLTDNLHDGVSFFHAEALRIKELALALSKGERVIAVLDEPFKGTNVKDAYDASGAILDRFSTKAGSLFMFSSHLIELSDQMSAVDQVDCRYFEAGEKDGKLFFEHVLHSGVSSQRLGMRVLKEEGIFDLLDN